jgi:hypothetical protein
MKYAQSHARSFKKQETKVDIRLNEFQLDPFVRNPLYLWKEVWCWTFHYLKFVNQVKPFGSTSWTLAPSPSLSRDPFAPPSYGGLPSKDWWPKIGDASHKRLLSWEDKRCTPHAPPLLQQKETRPASISKLFLQCLLSDSSETLLHKMGLPYATKRRRRLFKSVSFV